MSTLPTEPQGSSQHPAPEHYEDPVLLEEDETIPPRPEEEIADQLRQDPSSS